jgi:hypothetical protein
MRQHDTSDLVGSLDNIRPTQVKAGLHPTFQSDSVRTSDGLGLGDVIRDAVLKHYGSVKAAAISLGNVDPSLMQREFEAGKFGRLNEADAAAKAAISEALYQVFGRLEDPKACARRAIREIEERVNTLRQFVEDVA